MGEVRRSEYEPLRDPKPNALRPWKREALPELPPVPDDLSERVAELRACLEQKESAAVAPKGREGAKG